RQRIGYRRPAGQFAARLFLPVPGGDLGPARQQGLRRRHSRAGEAEDRVALSGKGGRDDHLSFSVARPMTARTMAMIQKRITTVDSFHPSCSKWCWIGAMPKIRLPVLLNQITRTMMLTVSITHKPPTISTTIASLAAAAIAPS